MTIATHELESMFHEGDLFSPSMTIDVSAHHVGSNGEQGVLHLSVTFVVKSSWDNHVIVQVASYKTNATVHSMFQLWKSVIHRLKAMIKRDGIKATVTESKSISMAHLTGTQVMITVMQ